jgi:uncharacterized membrane protein
LHTISVVLAVIGLLIASYVAYAKVTDTQTACLSTPGFNCDLVQHSTYSHIGPIPVEFLGMAGYLVILLALLLESRIPFLRARGKFVIFGLTLFGLLFSGYLSYIEGFVLHLWCIECIGSAITMALLFIVSLIRLWKSISVLPDLDEGEDEA